MMDFTFWIKTWGWKHSRVEISKHQIIKLSWLFPLWTRPKCDGLLHILGWNMRMKKIQGWKKGMKKFQGWDIQRTNPEAKSTFAIVDTTQMWWSTSRFHDQYKNENCCYHLGERKKWFTVCSAPRAVYEFAIQVRFFFHSRKIFTMILSQ